MTPAEALRRRQAIGLTEAKPSAPSLSPEQKAILGIEAGITRLSSAAEQHSALLKALVEAAEQGHRTEVLLKQPVNVQMPEPRQIKGFTIDLVPKGRDRKGAATGWSGSCEYAFVE